jgi:hypothetical protein
MVGNSKKPFIHSLVEYSKIDECSQKLLNEIHDDILCAIKEKMDTLDVLDCESHIWYGKFEDFINDYFANIHVNKFKK